MPHRLRPPQRLEIVLEMDRIDCQGEEVKLHSPHRKLALRHLLLSGVLGHSLALTSFRCHGDRERGEESGAMGDWGQWGRSGGGWRQELLIFCPRRKRG